MALVLAILMALSAGVFHPVPMDGGGIPPDGPCQTDCGSGGGQ